MTNLIEFRPNYYVSNTGNVYKSSKDAELLKRLMPRKTEHGYYRVVIGSEYIRIHRIVAQAFIPNPNNLPFVNHIDGNKLNNRVSNLEWCDHNTNMTHAKNAGLIKLPTTQKAISATINNETTAYPSISACARALHVDTKSIRDALKRKTKHTCKGYEISLII